MIVLDIGPPKYRGLPVTELPDALVLWLATTVHLTEPLRSAIDDEFHRRDLRLPSTMAPSPRGREPDRATIEALINAGRRTLAARMHPDVGGNGEQMKTINHAADWMRARLAAAQRP